MVICPHCQTRDGGPRGKAAPRPGDVAVCNACAGVGVFTRQRQLRRPTLQEDQVFQRDLELQRAIGGVLTANRLRSH